MQGQTTPETNRADRALVLREAAKRAVDRLNSKWGQARPVSPAELGLLTEVITTAAALGDRASADWIMLLRWQPTTKGS